MAPKKVYTVNLSLVHPIVRPVILAEIAKAEGIAVEDIVVEGA